MQYRAVLVQRDDVLVGQFVIAVTRGFAVSLVNRKCCLTVPEGSFGGAVSQRTATCRESHTSQLIRCLGATRVVEDIDRRGRVDALDALRVCLVFDFTNQNAVIAICGQMCGDFVEIVNDAHVER